MSDVIVKDSPIEGKGIFAARNFKKGEIVVQWDLTHILTASEAKKVPLAEKRYVAFLDGKYILMQPPARYMNHSCEPNTTAKNFCDVAIRDIKKGEEITANYREDNPPGFEMKCTCGSKYCKKIIRKT
ncbi:MAG: SET domain-containing protein [Candidatus Woesearchaeota archaeon]